MTAILNGVSIFAEKPDAKKWTWKWFGTTTAQKKATEEVGGVQPTFGSLVASLPRKLCVETFEKNTLVRRVFLIWYTLLNIILWAEAFARHADSPKGRLLRGECALPGRAVLPVDGLARAPAWRRRTSCFSSRAPAARTRSPRRSASCSTSTAP